jgi:hypothetical protein
VSKPSVPHALATLQMPAVESGKSIMGKYVTRSLLSVADQLSHLAASLPNNCLLNPTFSAVEF